LQLHTEVHVFLDHCSVERYKMPVMDLPAKLNYF